MIKNQFIQRYMVNFFEFTKSQKKNDLYHEER